MTIANEIPCALVAGDTWAWQNVAAFTSHPPPSVVRYLLRPVLGGPATPVDGVAGGTAYTFTITSAVSAAIAPGDYEFTILAFDASLGSRTGLGSGRITIAPDPATATGDLRTANEKILAAIVATIEGRATKDADSYSIEGRSIARTPMPDLLRLQAVYERRVSVERNPGASGIQFRRMKM